MKVQEAYLLQILGEPLQPVPHLSQPSKRKCAVDVIAKTHSWSIYTQLVKNSKTPQHHSTARTATHFEHNLCASLKKPKKWGIFKISNTDIPVVSMCVGEMERERERERERKRREERETHLWSKRQNLEDFIDVVMETGKLHPRLSYPTWVWTCTM